MTKKNIPKTKNKPGTFFEYIFETGGDILVQSVLDDDYCVYFTKRLEEIKRKPVRKKHIQLTKNKLKKKKK